MSYETRQVLWILLYLALVVASIIAAVAFQRRAGAGKGLLFVGAGAFTISGLYLAIQTAIYLALSNSEDYENPFYDLLPVTDLLFGGVVPIAGMFLLAAAVAKAGGPGAATQPRPPSPAPSYGLPYQPPAPPPAAGTAPSYPSAPPAAPVPPPPAPPSYDDATRVRRPGDPYGLN